MCGRVRLSDVLRRTSSRTRRQCHCDVSFFAAGGGDGDEKRRRPTCRATERGCNSKRVRLNAHRADRWRGTLARSAASNLLLSEIVTPDSASELRNLHDAFTKSTPCRPAGRPTDRPAGWPVGRPAGRPIVARSVGRSACYVERDDVRCWLCQWRPPPPRSSNALTNSSKYVIHWLFFVRARDGHRNALFCSSLFV